MPESNFEAVPVVHEVNTPRIDVLPASRFAEPPPVDIYPEEVTLPFSHYLWVFRRHLRKLLLFVAAVLVVTAVVSVRMTPVYESTATLYVDRQEAKGVVGQDSQASAINNLDAESYLASQIKLLESDSVVRPVAERYHLLDVERQVNRGSDSNATLARADNAPIVLKRLSVKRPFNTYLLQVSYRATDPELAADVANGIAQSFIEHLYRIRIQSAASVSKFMDRQLEELRAKMETSSARLAVIERELSLINPEEKTNIVSSRLLELNTEYTKAQAERVRAEAAFDSLKAGGIEPALVSSQGADLKQVLTRLNEALERFSTVEARYGANHPEYLRAQADVQELQRQAETLRQNITREVETEYTKAQEQERLLAKEVADTKAEYDGLNLRSVEYQQAKRDADADKTLYEELVKKIREESINAGFQNNSVRMADPARPAWKQVFPKLWLNLLLAFLAAALVGIVTAITVDALDATIRGPEHVTGTLRAQLIGTIPEVKDRAELLVPIHDIESPAGALTPTIGNGNGNGVDGEPFRKGRDRKFTGYDEAVRTARNAILLADVDSRIRTLLLTSATASEGKSTIAGHLAVAHAEQNRRTLLIDCDLRRPSQHRIFSQPQGVGLSDALTGEVALPDVIVKPIRDLPLDLILAGRPSRRAVDLIGQLLTGHAMDELTRQYDLIILDSPPLLGFPESLQMASLADAVVVVAHAGETNRKAVATALSTLQQIRAKVVGLILNQVRRHHSDHYYYYGYYGKYYSKYQRNQRVNE